MIQREHKIFIIKSYYSNGNHGENGNWVYSPRLCLNEFRDRLALFWSTIKTTDSRSKYFYRWFLHFIAIAIQRLFDHTIEFSKVILNA
jgi:hypothetical protein